jgi:hypothetical protein
MKCASVSRGSLLQGKDAAAQSSLDREDLYDPPPFRIVKRESLRPTWANLGVEASSSGGRPAQQVLSSKCNLNHFFVESKIGVCYCSALQFSKRDKWKGDSISQFALSHASV